MDDVWHEVEFTVGIELTPRGAFYRQTWVDKPSGSVDNRWRLVRVKLEVPESMWRLPLVRGKLKSDLQHEYQAFNEEIDGG